MKIPVFLRGKSDQPRPVFFMKTGVMYKEL